MLNRIVNTSNESTQKHRVLMIDLENCPNQIHKLMNNLEQYSQIVVCYAQSGSKVPLDWIIPLTSVVNGNRLKIVKMPNGGKNAADFGITFWAGMLMAQSSSDTHFDIVSNDADLDHCVSLLESQDRSAKRIGTIKENIQELAAEKNSVTSAHLYCQHLATYHKNRPVKKETLLNSIKSKFNGSEVNPERVLLDLQKNGVIALKENKITYNQEKISQFAQSILR
jgi:hypothetical protein